MEEPARFVTPLGLTNREVNSRMAFGYLKRLGFPAHDQRTQGPLPEASAGVAAAETDRELRERALRLACDLLARTGASAADATVAADTFVAWLAKGNASSAVRNAGSDSDQETNSKTLGSKK